MFTAAAMHRLSDNSFDEKKVERICLSIKDRAMAGKSSLEVIGTLTYREYNFFRNRGFQVEGANAFSHRFTIIKW